MALKEQILLLAQKKSALYSIELATHFSVSRQFVTRTLKQLVENGHLKKVGSTRNAFYVLPENLPLLKGSLKMNLRNVDLKEHEVLETINERLPKLKRLEENVRSIFSYAFTEMLNNAIEHSQSQNISVLISCDEDKLHFEIVDFGVGVYHNVARKFKLSSEIEAIPELLKGKVTTAPHAHSGEGIFFTSKAADLFLLASHKWRMRVDNSIPDTFIEILEKNQKGTKVSFSIKIKSDRHLDQVFAGFHAIPGEYAFDKTFIQVKLYTMGSIYVSRSQARRILSGLEKFRAIVFDFDRVPTIGQAFADEVFRVFKKRHPTIKIETSNANEAVQFMIDRVGRD